MPRSGTTTETRHLATNATPGISQNISAQRVLFDYGDWMILRASNQWGFDIVSLNGNYYESLIEKQDFDQLMQCFSTVLKQQLHVPLQTTTGVGAIGASTTGRRTRSVVNGATGTRNRISRAGPVADTTRSLVNSGA